MTAKLRRSDYTLTLRHVRGYASGDVFRRFVNIGRGGCLHVFWYAQCVNSGKMRKDVGKVSDELILT